jgi:hypothetical protein
MTELQEFGHHAQKAQIDNIHPIVHNTSPVTQDPEKAVAAEEVEVGVVTLGSQHIPFKIIRNESQTTLTQKNQSRVGRTMSARRQQRSAIVPGIE